MKRFLSILICTISAIGLHAESVWTGNAAVAAESFFAGESISAPGRFRAASNSFPSGTVLSVTNPRGGISIDVTVAGRLQTPGVFILLDSNAAKALNLPVDQVVPVRVSPRSSGILLVDELVENELNPLSEDIDYNPLAGLAAAELPADKLPTDELNNLELDDTESNASPPKTFEGEPVLIESYTIDDPEPVKEIIPESPSVEIAAELPTEEILLDDLSAETDMPIDSEKYIYFLSPSDLRPPVSGSELVETPAESVDDSSLNQTPPFRIPIVHPEPGSRYVQIGAYKHKAVLEDATIAVGRTHSAYPVAVVVEERAGAPIYKLLIGPLRPAETGIVLQTARSTLFPDAFPYSP